MVLKFMSSVVKIKLIAVIIERSAVCIVIMPCYCFNCTSAAFFVWYCIDVSALHEII